MQTAQIISCIVERSKNKVMFITIGYSYTRDDGTEGMDSLLMYDYELPWKSANDIWPMRCRGCAEQVGLPVPEEIRVSVFGGNTVTPSTKQVS